jgi:hypothetical protein
MKRKLIDTPTSRRKGRHVSSTGKKKVVDNFSMTQEEFHDNVRWVEEPSPREVHDSVPLPAAVTNVIAVVPTMKPPLRKRFNVASD